MEDIRDTRPWFWILIVALAAVAVVALVIAISANNESVDEKKLVNEATEQVKEEVAGLNGTIETAEELQAESAERQKQDQQRIKREVNQAVAGGEAELSKLKRRVASLETEVSNLAAEDEKLKKGVNDANLGQEAVELENEELDKRLTRLEKRSG